MAIAIPQDVGTESRRLLLLLAHRVWCLGAGAAAGLDGDFHSAGVDSSFADWVRRETEEGPIKEKRDEGMGRWDRLCDVLAARAEEEWGCGGGGGGGGGRG